MNSINAVACEEVFDESSHPSIDEIHEYASKIGIDPDSEPHLLPLATEGLMRALPSGWKPCYDEKSKRHYYFNNASQRTQWEHPLDEIYRGLVQKKRSESQSLSLNDPNAEDATYTRDEMPSLDEPPFHFVSPSKLQLEPITMLGARKKELPSPSSIQNGGGAGKLAKQKSEERPDVPKRLSMFCSFDAGTDPSSVKDANDIKIGGGAMFLKSNTSRKLPPPSKAIVDAPAVVDTSGPPRGILRERSFIEPSRSMDFSEQQPLQSAVEDKSLKDDDDKKSVRFNLESHSGTSVNAHERDATADIKKVRSRFAMSPIGDMLAKLGENIDEPSNMRLIKPNPKDFIKPKLRNPLESDSVTNISDSEDDSIMKSIDFMDKKATEFKERMDKSESIKEMDNAVAESARARHAEVLLRKTREEAERDYEEKKKAIWEDMNDEIAQYRSTIQESQKVELERVLVEEKAKYEALLENNLSELKADLAVRNDQVFDSSKKELTQIQQADEQETLQEEFKSKLDSKRGEMERKMHEQITQLEHDFNVRLDKVKLELTTTHQAVVDQIKLEHAASISDLKQDLKAEEQTIRRDHQVQVQELRRKASAADLDTTTHSISSRADGGGGEDHHDFEKVRCEKRLLEDKYRCLKDKYLRLKTEVKLSIEKRNRRRVEQNAANNTTTTTTTTGSETERSNSVHKERSPIHKPPTAAKRPFPAATSTNTSATQNATGGGSGIGDINSNNSAKNASSNARSGAPTTTSRSAGDSNNVQVSVDLDTSLSDRSGHHNERDSCSDDNVLLQLQQQQHHQGRSRRKLFSRLKSSSTSRATGANNNNVKNAHSPPPNRSCSPVENLRRQLQKLEDLEDEFPVPGQPYDGGSPASLMYTGGPMGGVGDTYHLRYPFQIDDQMFGLPGGGELGNAGGNSALANSGELEFFRHRIHVERDSIRRAKESLRTQRCLFQKRQNDLKLRHGTMARNTLQQLCQEEKDLTDMEVSLHRTRSLLGEKVIRLRHLEQSLQRAAGSVNYEPSTSRLMGGATGHVPPPPPRLEDATATLSVSDLSSHSASSGISSTTEFATADAATLGGGLSNTAAAPSRPPQVVVIRGEHLQQSSEIYQSLECLNAEIRDIWQVLNKQRTTNNAATNVSSIPLVYPGDLNWPMLAAAAASAASTSSALPVSSTAPPPASSTSPLAAAITVTAAPPSTHTTTVVPPSIPTLADRLHNYRQQVALANAQSTMVTAAGFAGFSGGGASGSFGFGSGGGTSSGNMGACSVGSAGGGTMGAVSVNATTSTTTTLVERTRNLRQWLRHAGIDPTGGESANPPEATL